VAAWSSLLPPSALRSAQALPFAPAYCRLPSASSRKKKGIGGSPTPGLAPWAKLFRRSAASSQPSGLCLPPFALCLSCFPPPAFQRWLRS